MTKPPTIANRISKNWTSSNISIGHSLIEYANFGKMKARNEGDFVRLHFGLSGSYSFDYQQLNAFFDLTGHHNNIMYSDGLDIEVTNKSLQIETFGINFTRDAFIQIAKNGNDPLKRFAHKVAHKEQAIFSKEWKTNTFKIQQVISEIINCAYINELKDLFLLSKSIELLVLQAALYDQSATQPFIKNKRDKQQLIEAKEYLKTHLLQPPTIVELAKLIGLNEYKLKKGFKELFGTTIFGFIHQNRMTLAKQLLLDTQQSVKEIAYQIGYSSPQHFSKTFKKEFGQTPNSIRINPNSTTP